jgi:hypothetical protein
MLTISYVVLLFSRYGEASVHRVAKKLAEQGANYRLVYEEDIYTHKGVLLDISAGQTNLLDIPINEIKAIFLRKWNAHAINNRLAQTPENTHAMAEYEFVFDFIGLFPHMRKLGFYNAAMHNKLYQQFVASKAGLSILRNVVCNIAIPVLNGQLVSKHLNRSYFGESEYANHKTVALPEAMPSNFGLAYLQPLVKKQFEIRLLYLDGATYAIAYLLKKESEPDRRYLEGNRVAVPFQISKDLQNKLKILMQSLGGNYALIDLLYDDETDEFYFLEANPFGQYGDLIKYGGYDIDGAIVNYLLKIDETKKMQL